MKTQITTVKDHEKLRNSSKKVFKLNIFHELKRNVLV